MDQFLCSDGQPWVWFCLWHTGFALLWKVVKSLFVVVLVAL